ncbi:MAG: heme-binding protein [Gammaproteobacteria bacterium]|nr:heme-binding protein [Gammaproteobacteria bacterium]
MQTLCLTLANELIAGVFAEAAARGLPPLAVAVLDDGGHLKAMQRQDGLSFLRADICQAKAWGALALGIDSRTLAQRYDNDRQQRGFIEALGAMTGGRVVPLPGGVLIRNDGDQVIGALGVAGGPSEQDEACAIAAIERLSLRAGAAT